jgi:hypothetical protein
MKEKFEARMAMDGEDEEEDEEEWDEEGLEWEDGEFGEALPKVHPLPEPEPCVCGRREACR